MAARCCKGRVTEIVCLYYRQGHSLCQALPLPLTHPFPWDSLSILLPSRRLLIGQAHYVREGSLIFYCVFVSIKSGYWTLSQREGYQARLCSLCYECSGEL